MQNEVVWSADLSIGVTNADGEVVADCLDDLDAELKNGICEAISAGKTDSWIDMEGYAAGMWTADIICKNAGKEVEFGKLPAFNRREIASSIINGQFEGHVKSLQMKRSRSF